MVTAATLRAEADRLDAEELTAAIEARCMSHGIEWNRRGLAYEVFGEFVECEGHMESYTDEYGTRQYCHRCNGNGRNFTQHRIHRPEYDAPRPPAEKLAR